MIRKYISQFGIDSFVWAFLTLRKSLEYVLFSGLLFFVGGIYIFPGDSGTQQVFYLLVVMPFIFLSPYIWKIFFLEKKYFFIYFSLPLYMLLSHSWAPQINISREWLFFVRQLISFFIFFFAYYYICIVFPGFNKILYKFIVVVGSISVAISLLQFFYIDPQEDRLNSLYGFSIVDIDKMAAITAIHFGFSLFFLCENYKNNKKIFCLLILFPIMLDLFAISLTHALGGWILVVLGCFLVSLIYNSIRIAAILSALLFAGLLLILLLVNGLDSFFTASSFQIRVELLEVAIGIWFDNFWFGHGLLYKSPIFVTSLNWVMSHPHNILVDLLRFGGVIGCGLFLLQLFFAMKPVLAVGMKDLSSLGFIWMVLGFVSAMLYGQQPYVRPGSYIWFFYWIPLVINFSIRWDPSKYSLKNN